MGQLFLIINTDKVPIVVRMVEGDRSGNRVKCAPQYFVYAFQINSNPILKMALGAMMLMSDEIVFKATYLKEELHLIDNLEQILSIQEFKNWTTVVCKLVGGNLEYLPSSLMWDITDNCTFCLPGSDHIGADLDYEAAYDLAQVSLELDLDIEKAGVRLRFQSSARLKEFIDLIWEDPAFSEKCLISEDVEIEC